MVSQTQVKKAELPVDLSAVDLEQACRRLGLNQVEVLQDLGRQTEAVEMAILVAGQSFEIDLAVRKLRGLKDPADRKRLRALANSRLEKLAGDKIADGADVYFLLENLGYFNDKFWRRHPDLVQRGLSKVLELGQQELARTRTLGEVYQCWQGWTSGFGSFRHFIGDRMPQLRQRFVDRVLDLAVTGGDLRFVLRECCPEWSEPMFDRLCTKCLGVIAAAKSLGDLSGVEDVLSILLGWQDNQTTQRCYVVFLAKVRELADREVRKHDLHRIKTTINELESLGFVHQAWLGPIKARWLALSREAISRATRARDFRPICDYIHPDFKAELLERWSSVLRTAREAVVFYHRSNALAGKDQEATKWQMVGLQKALRFYTEEQSACSRKVKKVGKGPTRQKRRVKK